MSRRSREDEASPPPATMKGVQVDLVSGGIPVVTLDASSSLHENVSWMLQTALDTTSKADSLYEFCEDLHALSECRHRLGLSSQDVALVRVKREDLRHVKAIGTTGKRSVMLAVVIALLLNSDEQMDALWKELEVYKLHGQFLALMQRVRPKGGRDRPAAGRSRAVAEVKEEVEPEDNRGEPDDTPVEVEGVDLDIVCGNVPVLGLEPQSAFHENISWLLQTALDCSGKADSTFEYDDDREILAECKRKLGLAAQETGIVRLRKLPHVKAVGTNGKRSMMLAIFVAYALHTEDGLGSIRQDVIEYNARLGAAFDELLRGAARKAGRRWKGIMGQSLRPKVAVAPRARAADEEGGGRGAPRAGSSPAAAGAWGVAKRKYDDGDPTWKSSDWGGWPRKKEVGIRTEKRIDASELDKQLELYFKDSDEKEEDSKGNEAEEWHSWTSSTWGGTWGARKTALKSVASTKDGGDGGGEVCDGSSKRLRRTSDSAHESEMA